MNIIITPVIVIVVIVVLRTPMRMVRVGVGVGVRVGMLRPSRFGGVGCRFGFCRGFFGFILS